MKNKIKNNIIGFVIGAVVFGSIGVVVAATIESSTIAYTTTSNNSVSTVEDALNDLYDKVTDEYIDPNLVRSQNISFYYWRGQTTDYSLFDKYEDATLRSISLITSSRSGLGTLSDGQIGYYIKTMFRNSYVVNHEACLFYNNKEFCLDNNYVLNDDSSISTRIYNDMSRVFSGYTISCEQGGLTYCFVGDSEMYCGYGDGIAICGWGPTQCHVNKDGSAACGIF